MFGEGRMESSMDVPYQEVAGSVLIPTLQAVKWVGTPTMGLVVANIIKASL